MQPVVAPNVQNSAGGRLSLRPLSMPRPMNRDFQIRFTAILLAIVTAAAASVPLDSVVILVPVERSLNQWLRLIALIYLGIGVYVLLRRWTAPGSTHFYIFCLVSFVFYAFKYTGKFNPFDWTIYWGNVIAW